MKSPSRPLHLAIVTTFPPGGGSLNEYAHHFVRAMRLKSEIGQITLLTDELPDGRDYPMPDDEGVPLTIQTCWRFGSARNALRIQQAVRAIRPDVVLFNIQFASFGGDKMSASLGLSAPALTRAAGFPTIVLLHNIMETVDLQSAGFAGNRLMAGVIQAAGNLFTRLLLSADLVALTIPKYVELLQQKYGASNVLLAPHGAFETPPTPDYTMESPDRIMTFGKFGTYKKVEALIEAVQLLRADGHPNAELVIAGTDSPNTPGYLAEVAERFATAGGIHYTGYVAESDVPRIFDESAVVVFPYTSTTGSSGVLHQAGSYGKAVVLPRIGDFAELVSEEGYAGEYFEPDNATSLRNAIARLLDDDLYRREMGQRNYLAASGLPIYEVADWYILHMQTLLRRRG